MSTYEKKLSVVELRVLLYVKWLEAYEAPEYPNYTVGQKIDVYESEPLGLDASDFYKALDKFVDIGLLEMDNINDMYELTEYGRKQLKKLELIEGIRDEDWAIKLWNGSLSVEDFLKEHSVDILSAVVDSLFIK